MRCFACNNILTPTEATRKFAESGAFTELCNKCLGTIEDDVPTEDGFYVEEEDEE